MCHVSGANSDESRAGDQVSGVRCGVANSDPVGAATPLRGKAEARKPVARWATLRMGPVAARRGGSGGQPLHEGRSATGHGGGLPTRRAVAGRRRKRSEGGRYTAPGSFGRSLRAIAREFDPSVRSSRQTGFFYGLTSLLMTPLLTPATTPSEANFQAAQLLAIYCRASSKCAIIILPHVEWRRVHGIARVCWQPPGTQSGRWLSSPTGKAITRAANTHA